MNNLLSYCGLVDTRISASEKDLPVLTFSVTLYMKDSKAKPGKGMDGDVDLFLGQCHETRQKNLGLMLQVYIRTQHLSTQG